MPSSLRQLSISTRTPLAGSDVVRLTALQEAHTFQPALPLWGVTCRTRSSTETPKGFQPALPLRGVTAASARSTAFPL